jgi:hypothetical protein
MQSYRFSISIFFATLSEFSQITRNGPLTASSGVHIPDGFISDWSPEPAYREDQLILKLKSGISSNLAEADVLYSPERQS